MRVSLALLLGLFATFAHAAADAIVDEELAIPAVREAQVAAPTEVEPVGTPAEGTAVPSASALPQDGGGSEEGGRTDVGTGDGEDGGGKIRGGGAGGRAAGGGGGSGGVDCDVTEKCSGHALKCKQKPSDPSKYRCTCEEGFAGHDCSRSAVGGENGGSDNGGGREGEESTPEVVASDGGLASLSPELLQKAILFAVVCAGAMACVCLWVVCKSSKGPKPVASPADGAYEKVPTTDTSADATERWEDWGEEGDDVEMQATSAAIMSSQDDSAPAAATTEPVAPPARKLKEPAFGKKQPVPNMKEPAFARKEDTEIEVGVVPSASASASVSVPTLPPSAAVRKDPEKKPEFVSPKRKPSFDTKELSASSPATAPSAASPVMEPAKIKSPGIPGMSLSMAKKPDRKRDRQNKVAKKPAVDPLPIPSPSVATDDLFADLGLTSKPTFNGGREKTPVRAEPPKPSSRLAVDGEVGESTWGEEDDLLDLE